jgi:hypothetical protein
MFNKQQYIEYLIATVNNYTCTNLADHLEGTAAVSHDTICDFLATAKLTPRGLWHVTRTLLQDGPDSYLVLDDSVQNKEYSKKIALVKLQYSGAEHGLVRGIGVLNLLHTSGAGHAFYPIDYRVYDPAGDGKTKNDHFLELLTRAFADKGIQARYILFDSWYASVANLKYIHRQGRIFVTTLKSNRKVSLSPDEGYIHLDAIDWTPDRLQFGVSVKLKEVPFRVQLFKVIAKKGEIDWVITNEVATLSSLTVDVIRARCDIRWQIEQFHREAKQLVGTEKCQCRSARAQRNHLACSYHAWVAISVYARAHGLTLYDAVHGLLSAYLRRELRQPTIRAVGRDNLPLTSC